MNVNIIKGVGLVCKAVWELTEGDGKDAWTDFLASLGLFGVHTSIVGAMEAKGMSPPSGGSASGGSASEASASSVEFKGDAPHAV